jgi:hypothetical protein
MKTYLLCFALIMLSAVAQGQDTLPNLSVKSIGNNVVISWTNQYAIISNIKIQRSFDSIKNFTTIGTVLNVFNRTNGFVDAKPPYNKMFYRLFISFEGGSYIFTKSYRPVPDTSSTYIARENSVVVNTWFTPSRRIYTGRDNNVIISLPDANSKNYSVKFFEENGAPLFEIKKVTDTYLTLEKVNFVHAGMFHFEIYEGETLIEKHKFYIAKDGKAQD